MARRAGLLYGWRRKERGNEGRPTPALLVLWCPDGVKVSKAIEKARSQQSRAGSHQRSVGHSWRSCRRGEHSAERDEDREMKCDMLFRCSFRSRIKREAAGIGFLNLCHWRLSMYAYFNVSNYFIVTLRCMTPKTCGIFLIML